MAERKKEKKEREKNQNSNSPERGANRVKGGDEESTTNVIIIIQNRPLHLHLLNPTLEPAEQQVIDCIPTIFFLRHINKKQNQPQDLKSTAC